MSIQPWTGSEPLTVEARNADGSLRFDCEQPPSAMLKTNLDALYQAMWRERPEAVGTWDALREWLASKSWTARRITW